MKTTPKDIERTQWPALSWAPEARAESLEALAKHVTAEGEAVIRWYLDSKKAKRIWARLLRGLALLLLLVAAIVPLLAEMYAENGRFALSPAWASMALVLAAGCVGFDRFFGFSSAWMRFITTELRVRQVLRAFQLDWETRRAGWQAEPPDTSAMLQALDACKACLMRFDSLVLEETERWVQEFSAAIEEIDKSARAMQAHEQRGAVLNITVSNADAAPHGWTLSLDDGPPERHHGRTAARANLVPGPHRLVVQGEINGSPKGAERAFTAAPGATVNLEMTLT